MPKAVTLRLGDDMYAKLREAAVAERRSLSNLIETAALARIRKMQFVDGEEVVKTLSDDAFLRRLKSGSNPARRRKGDIAHAAGAGPDGHECVPRRHVPELPDSESRSC